MSSTRSAPEPDLIIGYTTRRHLLLDLDKTTLPKVARLTRMIMDQWPEVGDALIMRSSEGSGRIDLKYDNYHRPYHKLDGDSYHLIFNNTIGYNKCCRIIEALAGVHILNRDYVKLREFRGDMTLRVSPQVLASGVKPAPVAVAGIANKVCLAQGEGIARYLDFSAACARLGRGLGLLEAAVQVVPAQAGNGDNGQP